MQDSNTEAIRTAERIRLRTEALSGAAVAIAAASRDRAISPDEIHQMLDVIACDMRYNADRLLDLLTGARTSSAAD